MKRYYTMVTNYVSKYQQVKTPDRNARYSPVSSGETTGRFDHQYLPTKNGPEQTDNS